MDGHLLCGQPSVLEWLCPLFAYVSVGKVYKFVESVVAGGNAFCLGDLAYLAVVSLHGIGRVDDAAYRLRVLEIAAQVVPLVAPRLDNDWVLLAPLPLQVIQLCLRQFLGFSTVNELEVS